MEGHTRGWHLFISGECVFSILGISCFCFVGGFAWINVIWCFFVCFDLYLVFLIGFDASRIYFVYLGSLIVSLLLLTFIFFCCIGELVLPLQCHCCICHIGLYLYSVFHGT